MGALLRLGMVRSRSPMGGPGTLDVRRADELVSSLIGGNAAAWPPLMAVVGPALLDYAKRCRSLGHRRSDDDCREVMTLVLERLRKSEFRALRTYEAWRPANPQKTLEDWLRIVVDRVACDYVSRHAQRSVLHTLGVALDSGMLAGQAGMTDAQAVRELLEHAAKALPAEQVDALRRALDGRTLEDIARETGCSTDEVTRRLRAAHARLRRWVDDEAA